jgi:hypothetical protein
MDDRQRGQSVAADRRARSLRLHRTAGSVLRDAWWTAVDSAGWMRPQDWWTPATDALAQAVAQRRDVRPAGAGLGRARAQAGHGIRLTLEDVFALYRQMPAGAPPSRLVRAVVEAWAEVALAPTGVTLCGDPRKGSLTAHYLRTLLGGVYQLGGDAGPPLSEEFVVLIVDVPLPVAGTGWEPVTLLLELGTRLLPVLPAQALLVTFSPGRLGTLVRRTAALSDVVADLTAMLPDDGPVGSVVLTTEIPEDLPSAHRLLERVAR